MTEFLPSTQQTPVDPSTEQWFDSLQATPEPPKKSRKMPLMILAAGIVILAIGAGVLSVIFSPKPLACLDAADYKALSGTDVNEVAAPPDELFSNYIAFQTGSTAFDTTVDIAQHGTGFIQTVAQFYAANKDTKSIIISIRTHYFSADASSLATSQAEALKSALTKAGVPSSAITTVAPAYIEPETTATQSTEVILSISSDQTCH